MIGVRTADHTQGVDHANGIHSEYLSWSDTMRYVFLKSGDMLNVLLIQDGSARTKVDSENKTWLYAFYFMEGVAFDNGRGGWGKKDPFPEYKEM